MNATSHVETSCVRPFGRSVWFQHSHSLRRIGTVGGRSSRRGPPRNPARADSSLTSPSSPSKPRRGAPQRPLADATSWPSLTRPIVVNPCWIRRCPSKRRSWTECRPSPKATGRMRSKAERGLRAPKHGYGTSSSGCSWRRIAPSILQIQ